MKFRTIVFLISAVYVLNGETLFQVKDSTGSPVMTVEDTGMTLLNGVDTLMTISSQQIKAFIDQDGTKGLSRSFTIASSGARTVNKVFEVFNDSTDINTGATAMQSYGLFNERNIFIGLNAGANTEYSVAYGGQELGIDNIFLGNDAGVANISGWGNIFIGKQAGLNNGGGWTNMFIGNNSGMTNEEGYANLFIGDNSGASNYSGSRNTFVGYHSGITNSSGGKNTVMGYDALRYNSAGSANTVMGYSAGDSNPSGEGNSIYGSDACGSTSGGSYNSVFGCDAGKGSSESYSNNSFFGYKSGTATTTGSSNTYLGYQTGYTNTTGTGNVFLGNNAGYSETGSNKLYIDNSSTTAPLIWGDFSTNLLRINGTLRVGTLDIGDLGNDNLGLDGDVVPFGGSRLSYDLGNNVAGEYWDDVVALEYITYSDRNTKNSIEDINRGLKEIMELRPVSFRYNKDITADDRIRYGLIAQEVENVIPEVVVSEDVDIDPETGKKVIAKGQYKALNYNDIIPVLIKSVQEQQAIIEEQKEQIDTINTELAKLKEKFGSN